MKNRKTIFTIIFALVLALSIATVSAAAISANETKPGKPATKPNAACEASDDCGVQPLKSFVESLRSLTPEEKAALLADLAEIERYENQINERCLPIRKHRGAREKRYSFGYAVFLILALMK